ncbi:trehalose-phosphatase-domain-containing protein [Mycena sanguinolenta]|nr:trehalose-phosphatase-domain-containing protein [Mycena sanguinolenta]
MHNLRTSPPPSTKACSYPSRRTTHDTRRCTKSSRPTRRIHEPMCSSKCCLGSWMGRRPRQASRLHPARRAVEPVRREEAVDYDAPSPQPSSRWNHHYDVVYIISKHDGAFLEQRLGHLKRVRFSAEHGGFMRAPGEETWMNLTEKLDRRGGRAVPVLYGAQGGERGRVKNSSIMWHDRGSDPEWARCPSADGVKTCSRTILRTGALEVLVGKKNLEVRPIAVNKGEIVKRLLYKNPDAELIFAQGVARPTKICSAPSFSLARVQRRRRWSASLSVTLFVERSGKGSGSGAPTPVELAIKPDCVFTTAVGHSSKRTFASWHVTTPRRLSSICSGSWVRRRIAIFEPAAASWFHTLASWHVTTPQEIVDHMLGLAGETAQSHL